MSVVELIFVLVIAGVCGALGQLITGFSRGGFLASVGIGLVGALIGTWVARATGVPDVLAIRVGDTLFPIVWAIAGSALFVGLLSLISRSWPSRRRHV